MSLEYPSLVSCAGAVTGSTGVAKWTAGAATARTSAGVWTLTLDQGADALESSMFLTRIGAAPGADGVLSYVVTSDTVRTVTYTVAGAATDIDWSFMLIRAPLT